MGWYPGAPPGPVRSDSLAASWIVISLLPPPQRGLAAASCRLPTSAHFTNHLAYTESLSDNTLASWIRLYPKTAKLSNTWAQANWINANQFSAFLDQRVRRLRRLRSQEIVRSTTHLLAG